MTEYTSDVSRQERPDLATTIDALKGVTEDSLSATMFYGLSGRTQTEFEQLRPHWEKLSSIIRQRLLRRMVEVSEMDFEMDYGAVGFYSLDDPDPSIREIAIELLWEDESSRLQSRLESLAVNDPDDRVRAKALIHLGRFILLGELGNIQENAMRRAQAVAIAALQDTKQPVNVRRRALEAISNSSHDIVNKAIRVAYFGDEQDMRIGSIFAMGRSCDNQWRDIVLEELESSDDEIRFEAARASGELEIQAAIPHLARLTAEVDLEIKEIAIWALGEIGGSEAMRVLRLLAEVSEEADDVGLLEAIEEAMGSASLAGGDLPFMLEVDEDDIMSDDLHN